MKRFLGQVDAFYAMTDQEVEFIDFLMITFVRTFEPDVYRLVYAHKDELTREPANYGGYASLRKAETHEARRSRWLGRLDGLSAERAEAMLALLGQLFLPIQSALSNSAYGDDFYEHLAERKSIGSRNYFDRYFRRTRCSAFEPSPTAAPVNHRKGRIPPRPARAGHADAAPRAAVNLRPSFCSADWAGRLVQHSLRRGGAAPRVTRMMNRCRSTLSMFATLR